MSDNTPRCRMLKEYDLMSEEKRQERRCEHEWRQLDTKYDGAILELVCVKCGKRKEIELFP